MYFLSIDVSHSVMLGLFIDTVKIRAILARFGPSACMSARLSVCLACLYPRAS